jgi:ankyrin repeat protein
VKYCSFDTRFLFNTINAFIPLGIDLNRPNQEQKTPFQLLLDIKDVPVNEMLRLVQLGANPNATNSLGHTLLHVLVARNESKYDHNSFFGGYTYLLDDYVKKLVQKHRVSVDVKNGQDQTPLQFLLDNNRYDQYFAHNATLLVTLGASPDTISANGQTLLHALITGNTSISRSDGSYLLDDDIKRLVQKNLVAVEVKNTQGQTPLQFLLDSNQYDEKFTHNAMLLVSLGAHLGTKNVKGHTLIDILEANTSHASSKAAIKELIGKYSAETLGGNYHDKKQIVAPLEAYTSPTKLSYFTRQHVDRAGEIIKLIIDSKGLDQIEALLQTQLDLITQCFMDAMHPEGDSKLAAHFASSKALTEKVSKHKSPEDGGYYKAVNDSLTILTAIKNEREEREQNRVEEGSAQYQYGQL